MQIVTSPGREVHIYPNVIELWQNGTRVIAYTPEEWGAMVQAVGITGLHPEPEGVGSLHARIDRQMAAQRA